MISTGNRSYGLELYINDDGSTEYSFCALEKNTDEITIVEFKQGIVSIEELKQKIKQDYPVFVLVSGKGILSKDSGDLKNPSFQDLFPGINPQDFYFISNNHQGYLARKKTLETIADSLLQAKLSVIGLSFGYALVKRSLELLSDQIPFGDISIRGHRISLENGLTSSANEQLIIGDETLPINILPAYCAALSYFTETGKEFSIEYQPITSSSDNFLSYRRTVKQVMVFAAIMLALIGVSSGLKFYYTGLSEELNRDNYVRATGGSRDSIIAKIKEKKKFLLDEDWMSTSKISFYADRLAAGLLKGISFNSMKVHPVKSNGATEPYSFESEKVEIKGKSKSELTLKDWTEVLKRESWISSAELTGYEWNSKTGVGEFTLLISLKK